MDFSDIRARTGKNTDTRLSLFYTQLSITDATPALSALFLTGTKIADYPLQDPRHACVTIPIRPKKCRPELRLGRRTRQRLHARLPICAKRLTSARRRLRGGVGLPRAGRLQLRGLPAARGGASATSSTTFAPGRPGKRRRSTAAPTLTKLPAYLPQPFAREP